MTTPTEEVDNYPALARAVGDCILTWAVVELQIIMLFDVLLGRQRPISDRVFGAIRSFEARLQMVREAVVGRVPDKDSIIRTDWKLLSNRCISLSQLRNQIAHGTAVNQNGMGDFQIEPFFNFSVPRERIDTTEIKTRTSSFEELAQALGWFREELELAMGLREARPPELELPIPHLVLRLRTEAPQRRAKHARPPKS